MLQDDLGVENVMDGDYKQAVDETKLMKEWRLRCFDIWISPLIGGGVGDNGTKVFGVDLGKSDV